MILLSITFFYTGLELTFFSSVYSTSVGATKGFGSDSDKFVGLTGILIGVGEIFGKVPFDKMYHVDTLRRFMLLQTARVMWWSRITAQRLRCPQNIFFYSV